MKRFFALLAIFAVIVIPVYLYIQWSGESDITIQYGARSEEGVLTGTGISLIRKGTHVFELADGSQFYVQSNSIELDAYSGQRVRITGRVEPNVSTAYFPLFVVDTLEPLEQKETLEEWSVPALGLTLSAPKSWHATVTNGVLLFDLPPSSSPLLIVKKFTDAIPNGDSVRVGAKSGTKVVTEKGQDVYVRGISGSILLQFTPPITETGTLALQFNDLLKTVRFTVNYTSSVRTGTGGVLNCGGSAGVLCPAGSYCDIQDPVTSSGICRKN